MLDYSATHDGVVDDAIIINYITGHGTRTECTYELLKIQFGDNFEKNIQKLEENGKVVAFIKQGKWYYRINN